LRSFAAGAYVATVGWVLVGFVLLRSGAASLAMGEAGEVWTSEELRRLRRGRWRVMNRVVLSWGDIDHVALGPGGVAVLETKWSADGWATEDAAHRIKAAVKQVERNAERIRGFIRPELANAPIHSAVVLWGPRHERKEWTAVESRVPVLRARELRQWLDELPNEGSDRQAVDAVWRRIVAQTQRRDSRNQMRFGPALKGIVDYVEVGWQIVIGALVGFVASATTLSWLGWKMYLPGALLLGGLGVAAIRVHRVKPFGYAWLAGTQIVTGLILGAVVLDWVRPS
jgi:hypothetical protein